MTLGDFLNLIAILLAIVSLAVANNKKVWLYKFGWGRKAIFIALSLIVHYFIFFPWFEAHGLNIDYLYNNDFPLPSTWAYVVSLFMILWMIWAIACSKRFPKSNWDRLLTYYRCLINSSTNLLIEYLKSYHLRSVHKQIRFLNKAYKDEEQKKNDKNDIDSFSFENNEAEINCSKPNLGTRIFMDIILNPLFVKKSIGIEPTFFLDCVCNCINPDVIGLKEAISLYFRTLIRERNTILVNELEETSNISDKCNKYSIGYRKESESIIVKIIFDNFEFTYNLEVFKAFGEEALCNSELGDKIFSQETNEWMNKDYESTPVYQFLRFTDIFIRELAIENKEKALQQERYIYIFYIRLICQNLIKNHSLHYAKSYTQKYVNDVIWNISGWIDIMSKLQVSCYVHNLLTIFADIAMELESCGLHQDCINVLERYIGCFFSIEEKEGCTKMGETEAPKTHPITDIFWDKITALTTNPKWKELLGEAWRKFDKIPYQHSPYIDKFISIIK